MSIEVRQMVIKSNVVQKDNSDGEDCRVRESAGIEEDVIERCRRMVLEMLNERRER